MCLRAADLDLFIGHAAFGLGFDDLWINSASPDMSLVTSWTASWTTNTAVYAAAFGDADGDGDLDLLTGSHGGMSNQHSLYINDGSGVFSNGGMSVPDLPSSQATAHVVAWGNADGQGGKLARTQDSDSRGVSLNGQRSCVA